MTTDEAKAKLQEAGASADAAEAMLDARWKLLGGDTIREALADGRDLSVESTIQAFSTGDYV